MTTTIRMSSAKSAYAAIAANSFDFSGSELEDLEDIASQCFVCGGDGVFLARSLYSQTEPTWNYDDWELCESANLPLKGPKAKTTLVYAFRVSPNPTSGWLQIRPLISEDFTGEFTIFNATGLKVLNTPLSFTDLESQYIDLGVLPTGLYTYAIYQDGKLVQSANISLIK